MVEKTRKCIESERIKKHGKLKRNACDHVARLVERYKEITTLKF